jgi:tripeptidyl-peptidase-1
MPDLDVIDFFASVEYNAAVFTSMVSLLNNEGMGAGKPGLGFLNPLIYSNPAAFNDMKTGKLTVLGLYCGFVKLIFRSGNNFVCSSPTIGFNSTSGWDPVYVISTSIVHRILTPNVIIRSQGLVRHCTPN